MEAFEFTLGSDEMLGKEQAVAVLAEFGRSTTTRQIERYWSRGLRGVRLPSLLVGGRRLTARRAIDWWIRAVNEQGVAS